MASGANGRVVVTQGPGKLPSGVIGLIGGDLLRELTGKLNPFAAQDAYTQLECTVVRADIVDGQVTVNPMLMQSAKVTIVAGGKIDLGTEALRFDFNTRPRTGVGISAGMFHESFHRGHRHTGEPKAGAGCKGNRRRRCDRRTVGARAGAAGPRPRRPGPVQADTGRGRRQGEMSRCRLKD
jgi:AsmA protein